MGTVIRARLVVTAVLAVAVCTCVSATASGGSYEEHSNAGVYGPGPAATGTSGSDYPRRDTPAHDSDDRAAEAVMLRHGVGQSTRSAGPRRAVDDRRCADGSGPRPAPFRPASPHEVGGSCVTVDTHVYS